MLAFKHDFAHIMVGAIRRQEKKVVHMLPNTVQAAQWQVEFLWRSSDTSTAYQDLLATLEGNWAVLKSLVGFTPWAGGSDSAGEQDATFQVATKPEAQAIVDALAAHGIQPNGAPYAVDANGLWLHEFAPGLFMYEDGWAPEE